MEEDAVLVDMDVEVLYVLGVTACALGGDETGICCIV